MGRNIEQQYTQFESNFLCSVFFLYVPILKNKYGRALLSLKIENTNISVHCLQSRVKVMGNKGEDTGKMGVKSMEKKNIFSQKNVTFKQNDR